MNKLLEKYQSESRWVSWRLVTKDGKPTKIPVQLSGQMASSTSPSSWTTVEPLISANLPLGIVFTPDRLLLGIDIDHCVNKETGTVEHPQSEKILALIAQANTYIEISPSGTGLHLFLALTEAFTPISNKKAPFELYTHGRYFTVTQQPFNTELPVRTVEPSELLSILSTIGYPWSKPNISTSTSTPTNLSDQELLQKMSQSRNADAIRTLYNGDTSKYNGDESNADMALLSHLAFWTGKDPIQMERIWLSSPLGSREKTQKRKDYRDRTISTAIGRCKEVYSSPSSVIKKSAIEFLTSKRNTKDGVVETVIQNTENICRILRSDPDFAGKLRYDKFRNALEYCGDNNWTIQEMVISVLIQTKISIKYPEFSKVTKDMVTDAIMLVSKENIFDSAVDYITSLKWDGTPRLDTWLCSTYGVPDDKYHRAVGSNWLKGLVKRIIEPGCKFDYVLVLEGEQGTMKSTSLHVLGGNWHVETTMSTDSKDFFMQFQGKAIIEFSEGETLSRTEVKRMKAIITMQMDKYRPPYERLSQDFPRRCVFAMTTNQTEYLKDETGNRRWLPITLVYPEANIKWLEENRDQLFAEAYHRLFNLKESIHEFPREETLDAQAQRRIQDPNTEKIVDWYMTSLSDEQRANGITVMQVFEQVINRGQPKPLDRYNEMVIGSVLREILKLDKKRIMIDNVQRNRYFSGALTLKAKDELDVKEW